MEGKIRLAVFGQKRLSREGGIEIVVKELCTRMAQNGCDITCYNRAGHHVSGAEYDKTIEYAGIRQKVVPTIEKKGLAAVSSSFFAALYSAFGRYDVVHIHAEGPAFFCWIPKLFGKRVISTIHGLDWAREKWKFGVGSKFIRQGEKNAVKYADEIIVLSKGVQKYFMETYGRETHFIPNGVNRPEVREAKLITDHFGLEKDSYILFLGRLVPEKGIRYLVEAFKNVKTDKKLVIAGGSSDTDSFMEELKELAKGDDAHDVFFVGRGIDYAVCLEGSLKLKEISYIHSEAYAAGELKHGTISLIEQGTLVIGVLTQSELYEKTISNMLECKSRGAYLMGLTTYGKYEIEDQVNFTVYVPKVDEHFVGSLAVIPLQLLGYYVSVAKGLDVDKPRNLAKSVTVE